MIFEHVELGPEDSSAPETLREARFVRRVHHVNFEERSIPDVVAVEWDTFAHHDECDVLRRLAMLVLRRKRERHGRIERSAKLANVIVDCAPTIPR